MAASNSDDVLATGEDALEIYQAHLDVMTENLMTDNFEGFFEHLQLPHHIRHLNAEFLATTKEEARAMFDSMFQNTVESGITQLIRLVTEARFVSPNEIVGAHRSEMLRGATRALSPYENRIRLVKAPDGRWKETHCANAIASKAGQIGLFDPMQPGDKSPELGLNSQEGKRLA